MATYIVHFLKRPHENMTYLYANCTVHILSCRDCAIQCLPSQCHLLTVYVSLKMICTISNVGNLSSDIQNWYAYQSSVPVYVVLKYTLNVTNHFRYLDTSVL